MLNDSFPARHRMGRLAHSCARHVLCGRNPPHSPVPRLWLPSPRELLYMGGLEDIRCCTGRLCSLRASHNHRTTGRFIGHCGKTLKGPFRFAAAVFCSVVLRQTQNAIKNVYVPETINMLILHVCGEPH